MRNVHFLFSMFILYFVVCALRWKKKTTKNNKKLILFASPFEFKHTILLFNLSEKERIGVFASSMLLLLLFFTCDVRRFFLPISFLWFPSFPRSPFLLFCSQGSCLVIFFPSLMKTNATKLINSFLFWRRQSSCSISWTTPCSFVISPFYFEMNDVKKKKNGFIERAGKVTWLVAFFRGAVLCTRKKNYSKK